MEEDELLDLVNANDEVVGTVMRSVHHDDIKKYVENGQYFRASGCILVNSKNQIWIPKRQENKQVAPGGLDFSMAEHVESGETYLQATLRGMQEELNMRISEDEITKVGKKFFDTFGAVMELYVLKTNKAPDYNPKDYQDGWWMSIEELRGKIKEGVKCKDALPFWLDDLERAIDEQMA